jgi:hypothetical protein
LCRETAQSTHGNNVGHRNNAYNHTTINNYLTINVVPLLHSKGDFLEDESLPERQLVRHRFQRKRASEAVPTYLQL